MTNYEYKLSQDEAVILKNDNVYCGKVHGKLILTNVNLVHISTKGVLFKNCTETKIPLDQIKIFNGKVQALLGKNGYVEIYLLDGQQSFRFCSNETLFKQKKAESEAVKWLDAINQLLDGEDVKARKSANTATIGVEMLAGVLGDTVTAVKNVLGINAKNSSVSEERVVKRCTSCGATLSGKKNGIYRCSYCNTEQKL